MLKVLKRKNKNNYNLYDSRNYKYFVQPEFVGQAPVAEITVVRIEHRPFYDSKWAVITPHFSVVITRTDSETAEKLLDEIMQLSSFTKGVIESLDEKDKIYYD